MRGNLDQQVRDAYQRAHECAECARAAKDLRERTDWMVLERRYLALARGIEFAERGRRLKQRENSLTKAAAG
jgi:hypothetical protein